MSKSHSEFSPYELINWLVANHGWIVIGEGSYSQVLGHPNSDRVIKLGHGDDWPDYIKWSIEKGWAGTCAPKVYSLKYHEGPHFRWYSAIVERGTPLSSWKHLYQPKIDDTIRAKHAAFVSAIHHQSFDPAKSNLSAEWLLFAQQIRKLGWTSDLKPSNWLLRKDGSLCLNDPVCGIAIWRGRIRDEKITSAKLVDVPYTPAADLPF